MLFCWIDTQLVKKCVLLTPGIITRSISIEGTAIKFDDTIKDEIDRLLDKYDSWDRCRKQE
jgi:hypothetical protein